MRKLFFLFFILPSLLLAQEQKDTTNTKKIDATSGATKYNLKKKVVGVLGLSFKAENDDIRDSLAIKLLKQLKSNKIKTLQSDEYYKDEKNISKKKLIKKSDIIIIATPHKAYRNIKILQQYSKNNNILLE